MNIDREARRDVAGRQRRNEREKRIGDEENEKKKDKEGEKNGQTRGQDEGRSSGSLSDGCSCIRRV